MSTPLERLNENKKRIRNAPGNDAAMRPVEAEAQIDCAIEMIDAITGLKHSVDDMANRAVTVIGSLTAAIGRATDQAVVSSEESTKVAIQSTRLAGQLNRLTKWVIAAAVLSAAAAAVQAGAALIALFK